MNLLDLADAYPLSFTQTPALTLQNVSDIVNPAFLHLQHLHRIVQVDGVVLALADQTHKLLGEHAQRVVVASFGLVWGAVNQTSWPFVREDTECGV